MSPWSKEELAKITDADSLHIAPFREGSHDAADSDDWLRNRLFITNRPPPVRSAVT
jgi:hypothetical protein